MVSTRKVTLIDVAVRAGVSATTASYILNGRSAQMRISADTERRVRGGRRGPRLPPQPQRPEPAHGHDQDHRRDLRLRGQRPVREPDADRGERRRAAVRPPGRDRRDRGRPRRRGAADRGDARPAGGRDRLRRPDDRDGHRARAPAPAARRAAQLRGRVRAACPRSCPTSSRADGRPPPSCSAAGLDRRRLRRRRGPHARTRSRAAAARGHPRPAPARRATSSPASCRAPGPCTRRTTPWTRWLSGGARPARPDLPQRPDRDGRLPGAGRPRPAGSGRRRRWCPSTARSWRAGCGPRSPRSPCRYAELGALAVHTLMGPSSRLRPVRVPMPSPGASVRVPGRVRRGPAALGAEA